MKDIFDLNNQTIVAVDRNLRLIVLWRAPDIFTLNIIDLKNKINELDTSKSTIACNLEEASFFAEVWLNEIRMEMAILSPSANS